MNVSMRFLMLILVVAVAASCSVETQRGDQKPAANQDISVDRRPNILLVVADDMGFSDIEPFGAEIETPTISRLAKSGVAFTNFYAAPTCSPSRAMLMTGMDNHIAGIGNMAETVADNQLGLPGYEGHLRREVPTIAERLSEQGYRTVMAGKWHLGMERDLSPGARGFDHAFSFGFGGGSHYSDRVGPDAHRPRLLYRKNGELNPELEDDFYSSTNFVSELIEGLEVTASTDKPFFAYLAFSAPHWPLQLPKNHVNQLAGFYDQGYDELRAARLSRQRALGLIETDASVAPRPNGVPPWDQLDDDAQRRSARVMEIYAGMIQVMDQEIARVLAYLEDKALAENTVIIFISDNGPDSWDTEHAPPPVRDHAATFDNALENMGKPGSFTLFDRGWGWVSGTPFRGYKGSTFEGGIRVPAIISSAHIENPGRFSRETISITDFAPTIMELAGISARAGEFTGRSIAAVMSDKTDSTSDDDQYLGVEIWGHRAIKVDDWKAVRVPKPPGDDQWMLFDLVADPGEQNDLANALPEQLEVLKQAWERYVEANNVVLPEGPFRIRPAEPLPTD